MSILFIILGIITTLSIEDNDWKYYPKESSKFIWIRKILLGRNISKKL